MDMAVERIDDLVPGKPVQGIGRDDEFADGKWLVGVHEHGGTMRNAARTFALHASWSEAIVVYPERFG